MKIVYMVSDWERSDYELHGIYSTRENAEKAQWLALIRECWGAGTQEFGTAGRSPAFRVAKSAEAM